MRRSAAVLFGILAVALSTATATAEPAPAPPGGGGVGVPGGGPPAPGPGINPGAALSIFLCPGVGAAGNALGAGGGYCDFGFDGTGNHVHCEWGGFNPVVSMWKCWRVFRGQPDHPSLPDPEIIPDGMGVPWAITGPTAENQWPPEGLAPGDSFLPPPDDAVPPPDAPPPDAPPPDAPPPDAPLGPLPGPEGSP